MQHLVRCACKGALGDLNYAQVLSQRFRRRCKRRAQDMPTWNHGLWWDYIPELVWAARWRCARARKSMRKPRDIREKSPYIHACIAAANTGKSHSRITTFFGGSMAPWRVKKGPFPLMDIITFFLNLLQILLPSQLCQNGCSRSQSCICAPIFARFLVPIQKFFYPPFAKGTLVFIVGKDKSKTKEYTPCPDRETWETRTAGGGPTKGVLFQEATHMD